MVSHSGNGLYYQSSVLVLYALIHTCLSQVLMGVQSDLHSLPMIEVLRRAFLILYLAFIVHTSLLRLEPQTFHNKIISLFTLKFRPLPSILLFAKTLTT